MVALKYIFILALFGMLGFQSSQEETTISWKANERLSWSDFKGRPSAITSAAAVTASGITYEYAALQTRAGFKVEFKIKTFFYPDKSWYKPDICDAFILGHEQLHFDISELYARKLRERLNKTTYTRKNVRAKVKAIYRQINKELNAFQDLYDAETNFSIDEEQQHLWQEKIAVALHKI